MTKNVVCVSPAATYFCLTARASTGHEGIQQNHLRPHHKHLLQDLKAVFFHDGHFYAFLLQRLSAGCRTSALVSDIKNLTLSIVLSSNVCSSLYSLDFTIIYHGLQQEIFTFSGIFAKIFLFILRSALRHRFERRFCLFEHRLGEIP